MRRMLTSVSVAAGVVMALGLTSTGTAQAADRPTKPMVLTLIGSGAVLGIFDTGEKGPTPGDVRTLSLTMSNTKSVPVGQAEVVQTLTRQQGTVGIAVKNVVIRLPKGTISLLGAVEFADFTNPESRPNDATESLAIVGGTGAYIGATGQADIAVLPGFTSRWTLTIQRG
jgi:hypothetical protein